MTAAPLPAEPLRPIARAPEPGSLWLRYAPRGWPAPGGWWLDLAKGELVAPAAEGRAGDGGAAAQLPELAGEPFDDVVWLPPVPPALRGERDRLAERLLAAGTPVLVQSLPGEPAGLAAAGATVVVDLTAVLLAAAGVEPLDDGSRGGGDAVRGSGRPSAVVPGEVRQATGPAATAPDHGDVRDGAIGGGVANAARLGAAATVAPAQPAAAVTRGSATAASCASAPAEAPAPPGTVAATGPAASPARSAEATPTTADAPTDRSRRKIAAPAVRIERPEPSASPFVALFPGAAAEALRAAMPGLPAAAVWPLVPGLTDRPDLVAAGLDALAAAGFAAVQPVVPRLAPADRRRLAEGAGDEAFDRLFHGGEPDERAFARAAAARGLAFVLPRPLPRLPLGGAANRRLAAHLAVAGELWLRLGRTPSQAQGFFRAARWADETGYDLPALAREGNLGVVAALDAASRALIEEAAAGGGEPSLVAELRAAYVAEEGA